MLTIRSSSRVILPLRHRKPRGHVVRLSYGRFDRLYPDGTVEPISPEWMPNFLAAEGQQSIERVYLLEQANPSKFIALLTAVPDFDETMATMVELFAPPLNGYERPQVVAGDWAEPILSPDDYLAAAAQKVIGPATAAWNDIVYCALVTTATGTSGKFVLAIPAGATVDVPIGESLLVTVAMQGEVCT